MHLQIYVNIYTHGIIFKVGAIISVVFYCNFLFICSYEGVGVLTRLRTLMCTHLTR